MDNNNFLQLQESLKHSRQRHATPHRQGRQFGQAATLSTILVGGCLTHSSSVECQTRRWQQTEKQVAAAHSEGRIMMTMISRSCVNHRSIQDRDVHSSRTRKTFRPSGELEACFDLRPFNSQFICGKPNKEATYRWSPPHSEG